MVNVTDSVQASNGASPRAHVCAAQNPDEIRKNARRHLIGEPYSCAEASSACRHPPLPPLIILTRPGLPFALLQTQHNSTMKRIWPFLLLLSLFRETHALCSLIGNNLQVSIPCSRLRVIYSFAYRQTLPNLADLRTPTPYTWTLSALATGCDTAPTTFLNHWTWVVAGTPFYAANTVTETLTNGPLSSYYETYTFPQMTVTSLYPGEALTLVIILMTEYANK